MNVALIRKNIRDARGMILGIGFALFAFSWLRVWIVGFVPMDRFMTIAQQFREFERFLPVPFEQLFTYSGRIALNYDELIVVMGISVWAIGRGTDCVSGELGRGTMEMLLAQPLSRFQLMLTQMVVTLVGTALLAACVWSGIHCGIQFTQVKEVKPTSGLPSNLADARNLLEPDEELVNRVPMSRKVNSRIFVAPTVNFFALGVFLAGLSTLFSSWDQYRSRAIGLVSALFVIQAITKIVGLSADHLEWLGYLTFFSAYEPEHLVSLVTQNPQAEWAWSLKDAASGESLAGPLVYHSLLLVMGLACYAAALVVFCRRDLPAPS